MAAIRVIPCLDVRGGRVVKGVKFQNLRDAGDVVELGLAYQDQGADELVVLDVSATPEQRAHGFDVIRDLRDAIGLPLCVGGGVRSVEDARQLLIAGADKVATNTAAVQDPSLIERLNEEFGAQCTVLAVDAARSKGGWEVVTHSGKNRTGRDAIQWIRDAVSLGAGEILLTSWDQDGTGDGYDIELLQAATSAVRVPIVASGGAARPEDLVIAARAGAHGLLAASIFHSGEFTVPDVKHRLADAGLRIRT